MWVNSADDFINPPELGIAEREVKRITHGRFVLLPIGPNTHGHGTHTWAVAWKQYLAELLQELARGEHPSVATAALWVAWVALVAARLGLDAAAPRRGRRCGETLLYLVPTIARRGMLLSRRAPTRPWRRRIRHRARACGGCRIGPAGR